MIGKRLPRFPFKENASLSFSLSVAAASEGPFNLSISPRDLRSVGGSALLFPFLVGGPRARRRCFMTMQRDVLSSLVLSLRDTMSVQC